MNREELITRLLRLDEDASLMFDSGDRFHLIIVGGGALLLMDHITRATHDIDTIDVSKAILDLLEKYDINSQVQAYINNFPYNYEARVQPLPIQGKCIDFFTASLEDIVIAKLYANRPKDCQDIESPSILKSLDWSLLETLATEEAKASALNDRSYNDFKLNYDDYVRRHRPCES